MDNILVRSADRPNLQSRGNQSRNTTHHTMHSPFRLAAYSCWPLDPGSGRSSHHCFYFYFSAVRPPIMSCFFPLYYIHNHPLHPEVKVSRNDETHRIPDTFPLLFGSPLSDSVSVHYRHRCRCSNQKECPIVNDRSILFLQTDGDSSTGPPE